MKKSAVAEVTPDEMTLEALVLQCKVDKYKLSYAALRWAKEIKQKENLPEAIQFLIPRALREILTNKVTIKEVEKLPMMVKLTPPPMPAAPTLTLNVSADDDEDEEETKKGKSKE